MQKAEYVNGPPFAYLGAAKLRLGMIQLLAGWIKHES